MWFKVDDSLATHPKVLGVPLRAMGLWVLAGSWSGHNLTDGHVPPGVVALVRANKRDAETLVSHGLWLANGNGYMFHDWEHWQPTRTRVEAERERVRAWRQRRRYFGEEMPDEPDEQGE